LWYATIPLVYRFVPIRPSETAHVRRDQSSMAHKKTGHKRCILWRATKCEIILAKTLNESRDYGGAARASRPT
ncbi:MAG: hypothetical protein J0I00_11390, partial [Burkholderiales bacterium]|nr:hypothetical protein [Burkholderiales bacterium]